MNYFVSRNSLHILWLTYMCLRSRWRPCGRWKIRMMVKSLGDYNFKITTASPKGQWVKTTTTMVMIMMMMMLLYSIGVSNGDGDGSGDIHRDGTPLSYSATLRSTETEMSSFWRNFHHWLHWKLSFWQLSVQPVMKISSKWRHFRFSDRHRTVYIPKYHIGWIANDESLF